MSSSNAVSSSSDDKAIRYHNAQALMAAGTEAMHEHIAEKVEVALGKPMPGMEIRVQNLSISADHAVADAGDDAHKAQLPTIANELKKVAQLVATKKHTVRQNILNNVNAVFRPGTMTLVLGQPGSGKSVLMKTLSGLFQPSKTVQVSGDVTYDGVTAESLGPRMPQFVSYVTQHDKHFPMLSVKETLKFAHACCGKELLPVAQDFLRNGTPDENHEALEAARALYRHMSDIVLQQLGLQNCQDTLIGDEMTRGVSGGERKRVTTGEMQFGLKFVLCMDEITTGLDSAAAFDILRMHRSLARQLRMTMVISLLQPSPEILSLFDDVLLLNQGHVMYYGPCARVESYFRELGLERPPQRDVADFLVDLGTNKQPQYETAPSNHQAPPRSPAEFGAAFERSSLYVGTMEALGTPLDSVMQADVAEMMQHVPTFYQSFATSTANLMRRQFKITIRNKAMLAGRAVMVVVMGLLYASVFFKMNAYNSQVVLGVIFTAVLFLALGQASQLSTFMTARDVFYKQRAANFYRTSSYLLASSVSQIPLVLAESLVFGTIIYWMCGLVSSAHTFVLYHVVLFLTNLAFTAWFFFLAAVAPDLHVGEPMSMVSVLFFVLFAGFVITKDQIPKYFIWIYWINPIAWGVRSLAVNQYRAAVFETCEHKGVNYCALFGKNVGEYLLSTFQVPSDKSDLVYGIVFLLGSYLLFMALAYLALEYIRYDHTAHHATVPDRPAPSNASQLCQNEFALLETPRDSAEVSVIDIQDSPNVLPVTLAFQDLWYSVPDPNNPKQSIDLLKGITGYAKPGTMTALMGSSGAGKTTLMDVIAGRKTGGQIRGKILLNGHEASDLAIRRSTGYCEQMDIHSEAATFREALTFSAFLRQSSDVSDAKKYSSVNECLDLLDMHPIADQIIRGSSTEQMKRLTIGVELAAQPSVLFLDEPTSGLDARSAKVIMDGVRKVANTGRTILCTIHQPSTEVFMLFDSLLVLRRGGETVFFGELGEECCELIRYFESIAGVPKLRDNYNPATWMLEVIGAGVGNANHDHDFVAVFNASGEKQALDAQMAQPGVTYPLDGIQALTFGKKRASTSTTQLKALLQRFFRMYWRTPSYNLTRFVVYLILALLFGLVFVDADYTTFQGINSGVGMIFVTTAFVGVVSFESVLPIASAERASFYRERAAQTYNALWYFVGSTLVEIPYVVTCSLIFTAIFFPMVGFTGVDKFFLYWLNTALHVLLQTYMGQFLVYALPTVEVAAIVGVLMNSIFFLFMGFNPPSNSIPAGYKWLSQITPQKYTLAILSAIVFSDCPGPESNDLGCRQLKNAPLEVGNVTVKAYVERVFEMKHKDIWTNFAVIVGMIVQFRLLALLSLRFINHQRR
uniref:ABC transporter domain-containing protein n=1 Tax=Lagenidium giganteum TaxID=4803 RepID=A0AAV2Z6L6_9STRA